MIKPYKGREEDFDWSVYAEHKKVVDRLCCGDIEMYVDAIKEITDRLSI